MAANGEGSEAPTAQSSEKRANFSFDCVRCGSANELTVAVGNQRTWAAKCFSCGSLCEVSIDAGPDEQLIVAEGPAEWADAKPASQPAARPTAASLAAAMAGRSAASSVPPKKRQKGTIAPPSSEPKAQKKRPAVVRIGGAVLAKFHDGYYYGGKVEAAQGKGKFLIAWDDGDAPSWVAARHVVLPRRVPAPAELSAGVPVLGLFGGEVGVADEGEEAESGVWFAAKVVSEMNAGGTCGCTWDEGGEAFRAPPAELRSFLGSLDPAQIYVKKRDKKEKELKKKKKASSSARKTVWEDAVAPAVKGPLGARSSEAGAASGAKEGFAVDLLRRSGRDLSKVRCCCGAPVVVAVVITALPQWRPRPRPPRPPAGRRVGPHAAARGDGRVPPLLGGRRAVGQVEARARRERRGGITRG